MRKRDRPEAQRGLAPLTIGLGPNFVAGEAADVVVETSWEQLSRVMTRGSALPLRGEPRAIAGHARDRYVYAPVAGTLLTSYTIGQPVAAGEVIARIDGGPLTAPPGPDRRRRAASHRRGSASAVMKTPPSSIADVPGLERHIQALVR